MRAMALDVGDKTIGIAVSDPLNITAQGLPTYRRQSVKRDVAHIVALCLQWQVKTLVYGNPIHLSGANSEQAQKVTVFVNQLRKKIIYGRQIDWPIEFCAVDERLTSSQAETIMKLANLSRKDRAKHVDKLAAQLILEHYLAMREHDEEHDNTI